MLGQGRLLFAGYGWRVVPGYHPCILHSLANILAMGTKQHVECSTTECPTTDCHKLGEWEGRARTMAGGEAMATGHLAKMVHLVQQGEMIGDVNQLFFRDPN